MRRKDSSIQLCFFNHLLKATRNESNVNDPANENVNSPINPKLDTNLNTNETETNTDQTATFTPQNSTIHLIMQPNLARTNKKKKRQYHKGRTRKSNCVYTDLVVNLSNYQLNEDKIKGLVKGLKFIPSPRNINKTEVLAEGCDSRNTFMIYTRQLTLMCPTQTNMTMKNVSFESSPLSHPNPRENRPLVCILSTWKKASCRPSCEKKSNISKIEWEAIISLRKNKDIVILEADKGGTVVVMNKSDYINEAIKHLNSVDADGSRICKELSYDCKD